ncbi:MAG TPA: outer membrane beta-barrel protein [Flavobacteriales bacterium]|nr:outer membrane beta-barrel protein [Flavobacteriales bacterium]HMR28581.1 outer membrane beta-barrel protein [Flavobacteriales bacterium]
MSFRTAATLALTLTTAVAHAQRSAIGIKGGIVLGTARSALVQYGLVPGATLGPYAAFGVSDRIELQPELLVSLNGASYAVGENDDRWVDRQLYAHLPLSVKLFVSNTLNLHIGGQLGWLLMARTDTDDGTINTTDRFVPLDAGVIAGLGLDLIGGTDLTLRYYGGVTPTLADDSTVYPRNNTLQFTVGYRFKPFKRRYARRR